MMPTARKTERGGYLVFSVASGGAIYVVARKDHAAGECGCCGLGGADRGLVKIFGLAGAELLEHEVRYRHTSRRIADAHAHAAEISAAHLIDNRAQAIVAGVPAAHLDAHVACGDVQLVVDYQQLLDTHLVLGTELGDGAAARIHVRLGLYQDDLALAALGLRVVDLDGGDLGSCLVFPIGHVCLAGELVDCFETRVVARLRVLVARVAKTGDHPDFLRLSCCHGCFLSCMLSMGMVMGRVGDVKPCVAKSGTRPCSVLSRLA